MNESVPAGTAVSAQMLRERFWTRSYPQGVPADLSAPEGTLWGLIEDAARQYPDAVATRFFGASMTYTQLRERALRFAGALAARGVGAGDRVALVLPNCPQFPVAHFGTLALGAAVVPCNPTYTPEELARQFSDADIKAVVTFTLMLPAVREAAAKSGAPTIIATDVTEELPLIARAALRIKALVRREPQPDRVGTTAFTDLLGAEPYRGPHPTPDDLAVLQYTGGTSGVYKAAELTHRSMVANVHQARAWFPRLRMGEEGLLMLMPFFHVYGLSVGLHLAALIAARSILLPKFEIGMLLGAIAKERPTFLPGAPRLFSAVVNAKDARSYDLRSLTACLSGSEPLPSDIAERFEALTGARIVEGYGLSEASPMVTANPVDAPRIGTVGLPLPGVEMRLVDIEEGVRDVEPGEPGELCLRGPNIMRGYWRNPSETAETLRDGWLHTGDIATVDADGYVRIVDRKKDMIIVGGLKVFPRDVEEVLYKHPAVAQCAVIGIPDRAHGEVVKAFVVLRPGVAVTPGELRKHAIAHLARYKVPRKIELRESLPMSTVGKILRRKLAEEERTKAALDESAPETEAA